MQAINPKLLGQFNAMTGQEQQEQQEQESHM